MRAGHYLAKASILSALKQYQYETMVMGITRHLPAINTMSLAVNLQNFFIMEDG